jgi:nitrogen regulatory protein PII 2
MITVIVEDSMVECAVETIINTNQTGKPGDGKVFIVPIKDAVRLRTGETGVKSIS